MTRVALDTNVLVYLAEVTNVPEDLIKIDAAQKLVDALRDRCTIVIPGQTLGELFVVLRRAGRSADEARRIVRGFIETRAVVGTADTTLAAALDVAVEHRLQFWDSLILSAAVEAGCDLFLSEDMQDGFVVRGMTIANPFAAMLVPQLADLLDDRASP